MDCRVPLLGAIHQDTVPGYRYNATEDCHFWAHFGARDRTVEGSRHLDFNRIAAYRLSEPFEPPLRPNGTALYIGAHRGGEDGVHLHLRYGLRMHVFEPSPTFFRSLREALAPYPDLTLHNFGLGARTRWTSLQLSGTASRITHSDVPPPSAAAATAAAAGEPGVEDFFGEPAEVGEEERVLIRAAAEAVPEVLGPRLGPRGGGAGSAELVELLHVNCEGCEYDVIEGLRNAGLLAHMEQVQIATHLLEHVEPGATFQQNVEFSMQVSVKRYCEMHRLLSESHTRVFGLPWVWERWVRRPRLPGRG